ncbi:FACT complex subunit SPT16 [Mycena indigotica]|uniref:FACT complex subunit SPT16 n=1 Tax=Mycena indigotica TaxID=2126181 RepID=A0A8H6VVC8_9AGAR|nr:FACT complex subunit SPT16 [Mycena indigotica]KAF7295262.1 FACT complex subunit SPT16 [Mycena indigotica]
MTVEHLPTIFSRATCTDRGLCPVTRLRNQVEAIESHSLYYEVHGTGPKKVVFIMGLNSSSFAWAEQAAHFGQNPEYSIVLFDNRGVGHSSTPRGPYTTSGMAADVIVLLDYLGWKAERQLHVVGTSMGGMIAQELALKIPGRIISLTLAVTTPGGPPWTNLPPWKGALSLAKLMFTTDIEKKIPIILEMVYPLAWLEATAEDDEQGRTNREIQIMTYRKRMLTTAPQHFLGAVSQMSAGLTHHVTPPRLKKISDSIPYVHIVTGDQDNLVSPENSRLIKSCMPDAELEEWEKTGHALHVQYPHKFNRMLERVFAQGERRC